MPRPVARLLGYDRPGYGGSTAHPDRIVADAAADVATIAGALGIRRLATWGVSGGGPHALACGALLPDLIVAAASLAAVAPYAAEGLDWLDGMGEENVTEFRRTLEGRAVIEPQTAASAAEILAATPETVADSMRALLSSVDAAPISGDYAAWFHAGMQEGLGGSIDGWIDDDLLFVRPWGFDVGAIRVPVMLWQGDQDRFVPPAHGRWLAARIPGVEAHLSPVDGHLTLMTHRVPEVHAWLLTRPGW